MCKLIIGRSGEQVEHIGGPDRLSVLRRNVEGMDPPSCPFCGGPPRVCLGMLSTARPAVVVQCERCQCSTGIFVAEHTAPAPEAINAAIGAATARWRRRL